MTSVIERLKLLLPFRKKSSPSGWTSFNAPCCHHRGHNQDRRQRAGIRFDQGFVYNCFNCKYTASWQPGRPISNKLRQLLKWMGAADDDINQLILEALKTQSDEIAPRILTSSEFTARSLPEGSLSLAEWSNLIEGELEQQIGDDFLAIVTYLIDRGYQNPFDHDFYWTPVDGYRDRVIIPFRWQGTVIGNTARRITKGRPKYLSDQPPHFVFNTDCQRDRRYVIVTEGPFDALAVGGVALLTNEISPQQARIINEISEHPILVPDRDLAGLAAIDQAIELGWSVAFPNWDDDVKDSADAVARYGQLWTVVDIIKTAQHSTVHIELAKKKLKSRLINDKTV